MPQIRDSSLIACHPLDSGSNVNSSIILHTVDDVLRQLEIKRENFSLFLTDAARYMSLAGKTLKELYPSLMHVTCVAQLLHNCAMLVRAHFTNIDEIIATIKNKDRKKDFHDVGLPSPPDPVITRWATWLRAALYYSENLPAVYAIVNNWTSAGLLVSRAKDATNVEELVPDLVKINQYRTLAANVEFLEGSACMITEAYGLLKNMQFNDDPCVIKNYIEKRLSNSDLETIINCTRSGWACPDHHGSSSTTCVLMLGAFNRSCKNGALLLHRIASVALQNKPQNILF